MNETALLYRFAALTEPGSDGSTVGTDTIAFTCIVRMSRTIAMPDWAFERATAAATSLCA